MFSVLMAAMLTVAQAGSPTDAQFTRAREALDRQMIDYQSARFRDVHADSRRICGLVNGRNRLGAYSGWQRFVAYNVDPARVVVEPDDEIGEIDMVCVEDPVPAEPDYSDRVTAR